MLVKRPNVMPVCYFPTTVFLIDDEVRYTDMLKEYLGSKFIVQVENNPETALDFFNHEYHQDPFWLRCLHRESTPMTIGFGNLVFNLPEIKKLAYNKDRFKQVTVAVVDYAMPGINGAEFLRQVKTRENTGYPFIKAVMLTGQPYSPSEILEDMSGFFKKDDDISKLVTKISHYFIGYFEDASLGIAYYLSLEPNNRTLCLMDKVFINFFKDYIKEHHIAEYYMVDTQGSFLMLDANANLSWLLVRNDMGMKQSIEFAKQNKAPLGVIQALEKCDKLLYIPDEVQFQKSSVDWSDYLHPVQVLEGQEKYYYAFSKDLKHHNIERDKIFSYEEYLTSVS